MIEHKYKLGQKLNLSVSLLDSKYGITFNVCEYCEDEKFIETKKGRVSCPYCENDKVGKETFVVVSIFSITSNYPTVDYCVLFEKNSYLNEDLPEFSEGDLELLILS